LLAAGSTSVTRLTFVRSGKVAFTLEDKTMEVGAGDFISILPDVPHSFEVISEEPLRLVELVIHKERK
jgi:quercetin dioxygenase-like cupin family protein